MQKFLKNKCGDLWLVKLFAQKKIPIKDVGDLCFCCCQTLLQFVILAHFIQFTIL